MTTWNAKRMRIGACALVVALGVTACGEDEKDNDPPADGSAGDGSDGSQADGGEGDGEPSDGDPADGDPSDGEPADGSEGGEPSEQVVACLADAIPGEPDMERVTFTGANGISAGIVRHIDPDRVGTSGTRVWLLDRFAVTDASGSACVTDADALTYTSSRHNFDDVMTAIAGDVTYEMATKDSEYNRPFVPALTKKTRNTVDYGPTSLALAGCTLLNDDSDCTERYSR